MDGGTSLPVVGGACARMPILQAFSVLTFASDHFTKMFLSDKMFLDMGASVK